MAEVQLFRRGETSVALTGTRANDAAPFVIDGLMLTTPGLQKRLTPGGGAASIPADFLDPINQANQVYRLKQVDAVDLVLELDLLFADEPVFFEARFSFEGGVSVGLSLHVPVKGGSATDPYLEICCNGQVEAGLGDGIFTVAEVGFCLVVDELPTTELPEPPKLRFRPPGDLRWPRVHIPWPSFPKLPGLPLKLPAFSLGLPDFPLRFGCESIEVTTALDTVLRKGNVRVKLSRFRVEGVGGTLTGSITFVFAFGVENGVERYTVTLDEVNIEGLGARNIGLKIRIFGGGCFGFDWAAAEAGPVLRLLGHDLPAPPKVDADNFRLRVHGSPEGLDEIRLDWMFDGNAAREFDLPGVSVKLTAPDVVTFLLRRVITADAPADAATVVRLTGIATFDKGGTASVFTTFAWPNEGSPDTEREMFRDATGSAKPLLSLTATTQRRLSLALFDFPVVGQSDPPRYFKAVDPAIAPLDVQESEAGVEDPDDGGGADDFDYVRGVFDGCPTTPIALRPLVVGDDGDITLAMTGNQDFRLPFLNQLPGDPALGQFIQIKATPPALADGLKVSTDVTVIINLGKAQLKGTAKMMFDVERMAFDVKANEGIDISLGDGAKEKEFLGLTWNFADAPDRKAALVLVLQKKNYQLRQLPGAKFTVSYDKATMPGDRIEFDISDFALTTKGVNVTATITDKPARLNGLETQFRFTEGAITITENRVASFSIAGTGPMPPDLVGDAVVDVGLRFAQVGENHAVRLVCGEAKIRGPKLLSCRSTRFEFELDGLGLRFVHDGGADHLYFTVTGKARYKLQEVDDHSGPLAWLPGIEMQLVDCPLTGNARVIAKHVTFLIELPKKVRFSFLGCFTMELRAIGFVPQFDKLGDPTAAMRLSGQMMFGDTGDLIETRIDLHDVFVALPKPGSLMPRLYIKRLGVRIAQGETFALEGVVDFFNGEQVEPGIIGYGFAGEGSVTIKGLPPIAASMAWLRVSNDAGATWKRAWFLYLEARRMSLHIPVLEIYIREIGFGFGYRYTLASIKEADETTDVRKLLKRLKQLAKTQGNLSKRDQWRIDLEGPGQDARWTVALRALFASSSAQTSPFTGYDVTTESSLPSLYVMDAVLAVRSDLTFFLAGRAWLNTNYNDFNQSVMTGGTLHERPLLSGFAMLSPRQKRFLANLSSNADAEFGDHPPLPDFLKLAIRQSQFTATLLLEPGLVHYELGWPNQLRWRASLGPLDASFCGGTIFRLSTRELVVGNSFLARGHLKIEAGFSAGFFGAGLYAEAEVAYGARYIGVLSFVEPLKNSAFYGAVGLDIRVRVEIKFWLHLSFGFFSIDIDLSITFDLQFTAALQVGITLPEVAGVLGTATVSVGIMGRHCGFNIRVGINDGAVEAARLKTERFLHIGLEAEDVEAIPGNDALIHQLDFAANGNIRPRLAAARGGATPRPDAAARAEPFLTPQYTIGQAESPLEVGTIYFVLIPGAQDDEGDGFFPVPPEKTFGPLEPGEEFPWDVDLSWAAGVPETVTLEQWLAKGKEVGKFDKPVIASGSIVWKMPWADIVSKDPRGGGVHTLQQLLRYAYVFEPAFDPEQLLDFGAVTPISDPATHWVPKPGAKVIEDDRVHNPTAAAFESAVRGAMDQFASPYFKFDPNSPYDANLCEACRPENSPYTENGKHPTAGKRGDEPTPDQSASELRSSMIQAITRDFFEYVDLVGKGDKRSEARRTDLEEKSLAFRFGLVFKITGATAEARKWLEADTVGTIRQRDTTGPDLGAAEKPVALFNRREDYFSNRPPDFVKVRTYAHANTVAIDWRLQFPADRESLGLARDDPRHHLRHYHVRREHLDGNDPCAELTLKAGEVVHKPGAGTDVLRLPARFQLADHFDDNVGGDVAVLTPSGKRYLYTITPIDIAGNASPRPLSVVVTRYPSEPPLVPGDGALAVRYALAADPADVLPDDPLSPRLLPPHAVVLRFSDPVEPPGQTAVPVEYRWLVFRRQPTLPAGFYGADEDVRGAQNRGLAVSNARRLRTDVVIKLPDPDETEQRSDAGRTIREAAVSIDVLREHDLFDAEGLWRPEGWQVFLQTESAHGKDPETEMETPGVLSALAPVSVRMEFVRRIDRKDVSDVMEDRQFARLEWLPRPVRLDLLPPTDTAGEVGFAKVPMPTPGAKTIGEFEEPPDGAKDIIGVSLEPHPARLRAVKLVWNQGPSDNPAHPVALHARYQVYEFDALATPGDRLDADGPTIDFRTWSEGASLRKVQEVDLVPADEIANLPAQVGDPLLWEAWYPSTARRLAIKRSQQTSIGGKPPQWPATSDAMFGPWFSWRESYLKWPEPLTLWVEGEKRRLSAFHPFLEDVASLVGVTQAGAAFPDVFVEAGPQPSRAADQARENVSASSPFPKPSAGITEADDKDAPTALDVWLRSTAPESDPYGWGILQRMGLSMGIRVRSHATGGYLTGPDLIRRISTAVEFQKRKKTLLFTRADDNLPVTGTIRANRAGRQVVRWSSNDRGAAFELSPGSDEADGKPLTVSDVDVDRKNQFRISYWSATDKQPLIDLANVKDPDGEKVANPPERLDPKSHFHLEYLFQPGKRMQIKAGEDTSGGPAAFDATLSLVQLSLRPTVQQALGYLQVRFDSDPATSTNDQTKRLEPGEAVEVTFNTGQQPASFVHVSGTPAEPMVIEPGTELKVTLAASAGAELTILLRAPDPTKVTIGGVKVALLCRVDQAFAVSDWRVTYFANEKASPEFSSDAAKENWTRFRFLLKSAEGAIDIDQLAPDLEANKPGIRRVLPWLDRFFGAGGDTGKPGDGTVLGGTVPDKHWIATGYPRAGMPLPLAPDSAGRLTNFRPIESLWAQAFRYFVRPRGRYELLWEEIGRSRGLFAPSRRGVIERWQKTMTAPGTAGLEAGGADVALGRIRPITAPFVLSSRRLERPAATGSMVEPGKTWEILVTKHPEQDLIERNRSLLNHLEYRQSAQSMFRSFTPNGRAVDDYEAMFGVASSPIYVKPTDPIAPGVAELFLFHAQTFTRLNLSAGNGVADVQTAINALTTTTGVTAHIRPVGNVGVVLALTAAPVVRASSIALRTVPATDAPNLVAQAFDVRESQIAWPTWEDANVSAQPSLPEVPERPDHLVLSPNPNADDAVSLDLPLRSNEFSRGLVAFQYRALPFYYTHKLLLVAQAAGVVSPITAVEHSEFEYESPKATAVMEGVQSGSGGRFRRIVITLARLWDSLPENVRKSWPIEDPDAVKANEMRFPGSLPDLEVIYSIVVAKPGSGNVEAVAEFLFKLDDGGAACESTILTGPFRGHAVRVNRDKDANALADPVDLETVLLPADSTAPNTELSTAQVSSARVFAGTDVPLNRWPANAEMYPRTCAVRTHAELTDEQADAIRGLIPKVDVALADALRSLLRQGGPTRAAETCVGLEQLSEIHDRVTVTPPFGGAGAGQVTWTGAISAAQLSAIDAWIQTSIFAATLTLLRDGIRAFALRSGEFPVNLVTAADIANVGLQDRLALEPGTAAGTNLLRWDRAPETPTDAELSALDQLAAAVAEPARAVVQALAALVRTPVADSVTVPIAEAFWRPRPTQDLLPAPLKDALLIGNGVVGFNGLMTMDEGKALLTKATSEPDKASVIELFGRAANSGLGGGTLRLVVRRGSAAPTNQDIRGAL
jgi:hypothetical protein